jgi:hypothetical protein
MPRIRTIKPEFWRDEKLASLCAQDRLVFLGLIGMADDFGRVHDNIKVIDAFVFPNSSETVRESLANLSRMVRIRRGNASNGMPVIEIVNWTKHQRVDKPQRHLALPPIEEKSIKNIENTQIPESFENDSGTIPELVATLPGTRDLGSGTWDQGSGSNCGAIAQSEKPKRFVPPTLEEVEAYRDQEGLSIDPEEFVNYYGSQGWKKSNGQRLTDWKKAAKLWKSHGTTKAKDRPKTFTEMKEENTDKSLAIFTKNLREGNYGF